MACEPNNQEPPLAAAAHVVEQGTPVAISLARKHLTELSSSSSPSSGTPISDATNVSPDLQHRRYLEQQHASLDQIIQARHSTQQPEAGFWSRLFSYPSPSSVPPVEPVNFHLTDKSSTSLFVEPADIDHTKTGTRRRRRQNQVLPLFRSQYHVPCTKMPPNNKPATITTDSGGGLFDRTLLSINHWLQLQQSPSHTLDNDALILDPSSWKQHIKARFARFIDDMKSDPHDLAGKKVVVIGVHGWFPMKVRYKKKKKTPSRSPSDNLFLLVGA
jgi:hypothetical protein